MSATCYASAINHETDVQFGDKLQDPQNLRKVQREDSDIIMPCSGVDGEKLCATSMDNSLLK